MSKHRKRNEPGDKDDFGHLPYHMRRLVEAVGFPVFQGLSDDEMRMYDLARHGRCMTCEQRLGEDANVIISRYGIVAAYCSGVCHSDMAVLGWLQEQHHDLSQRIDFRTHADAIASIEEDDPDEAEDE